VPFAISRLLRRVGGQARNLNSIRTRQVCEYPVIEDRGSPRQNRCFFRGFVYFGGVLTAVDCIVRDISDTGARLQFTVPQMFNGLLDLHIPIKNQSFHARVRWHDGLDMGVQFEAATQKDTTEITLDRRVDKLEAEIATLRNALKHLQKDVAKTTEAA
jgi:PilZ domain-containing protein